MPRLLVLWLAALGLLCGCGPRFPTPFTAEQMASAGTGKALVHYLHQPGATAAVCSRRAQVTEGLERAPAGDRRPHVRLTSDDDLAELARGLVSGDVRPSQWQRCAMLLLESAPPAEASSVLDAMAHAYRKLLSRGALETDPEEVAKVEALHQTFLNRPPGTSPGERALVTDVAALREALTRGRLGPTASRYGREVLAIIDLDHGLWKGVKLTALVLDELEAQKDEALLRRVARRVPDPELQNEARRRIVRLHLAASPDPELRRSAASVEARVLATGRNAVDLGKNTPRSAWLDEERLHVRGVLVRQQVWSQTATLLAYDGDAPGASVLPSLGLRGALFVRVEGLDAPVTLCAPPDALDVTPCVDSAELHPMVPIVYVDPEGLLHFVERVASKDAMRLVYNTPNLPLPFEIHGHALLTIEWPIVFEHPDSLVFVGPTSGRGPDLRVTIERRYSARLLFDVKAPAGQYVGVVEAKDLDAFAIASRGGQGTSGARGSDGSAGGSGSSGTPASCPGSPGGPGGAGGRGGNGTAGGPGGPGGPGGNVAVRVACSTGECGGVGARVRGFVRSEGGAGGSGGEGGRGGPGGPGGSGGSGTSCTDSQGHSTSLSSGTTGPRGSDGSPGARGADGPRGDAGLMDAKVTE